MASWPWGQGPAPNIFNMKNYFCVKSISRRFRSRGIYPKCIGVEFFLLIIGGSRASEGPEREDTKYGKKIVGLL